MSRLAAEFFYQPDVVETHAAISCLAHIVDRQQADAGCGECFHFDTGAAETFCRDGAMHRIVFDIDGKVGGDPGQGNRVAQGDQVPRAFGGLDCGDPRNTENIPFFCRPSLDQGERFRLHENTAGSPGNARSFCLGADVDHVSLAGTVKMSQGRVGHG